MNIDEKFKICVNFINELAVLGFSNEMLEHHIYCPDYTNFGGKLEKQAMIAIEARKILREIGEI